MDSSARYSQVDPLIFSLYRDALAFPILGAMALVFDVAIPRCRATQQHLNGKPIHMHIGAPAINGAYVTLAQISHAAKPKASLTMKSRLRHTAWFAVLGLTGMFGNQFSYIFGSFMHGMRSIGMLTRNNFRLLL